MPYSVKTQYKWGNVPTKNINEIRKWLYCFVGDPYHHWKTDYDNGVLVVRFIDKKDAIMFALKWSDV